MSSIDTRSSGVLTTTSFSVAGVVDAPLGNHSEGRGGDVVVLARRHRSWVRLKPVSIGLVIYYCLRLMGCGCRCVGEWPRPAPRGV